MKTKWISLSLCAAAFAFAAAPSYAQSIGETGLVGVRLYDSGMRLLQLYGNPEQILPAGAAVQGGGGRGPAGEAGGRPGGGGRAGGGGGVGDFGLDVNRPYEFGDAMFQLGQERESLMQAAAGKGGGARGGGGDGPGAGGGGGAGRGATATDPGLGAFMRWVYTRNGCRYGFILDPYNRVVQIEVVGLYNNKVRTKRGVTFGDTFKEVMNKYQLPESYNVNGNTIVMNYLTKNKVAFRLNRLGVDKPHVVTAIVVAAGKA